MSLREKEYQKNARKRYNKRYYARTTNAPNRGKRWDETDEVLILLHYESDTYMSKYLGRSVRAIQMKRGKLKQLPEHILQSKIQRVLKELDLL